MRSKSVMVFASIPLAVLVAMPVPAGDPAPAADANVLVTFTVGHIENGREVPVKSYEMLAHADGKPAEMMTGARVPIPTTQFNASQGGGQVTPMTSFTYQNVGFTARVEAKLLDSGRIRLLGNIEDSSMGSAGKDGRPIIQTLDQLILATLEDGVPLRINRVEERGTRSLYIQVQAEVLEPSGQRVTHGSD